MTTKKKKVLGILNTFSKKKERILISLSIKESLSLWEEKKTEEKLKLFVWSYIKSFSFSTLKKETGGQCEHMKHDLFISQHIIATKKKQVYWT